MEKEYFAGLDGPQFAKICDNNLQGAFSADQNPPAKPVLLYESQTLQAVDNLLSSQLLLLATLPPLVTVPGFFYFFRVTLFPQHDELYYLYPSIYPNTLVSP